MGGAVLMNLRTSQFIPSVAHLHVEKQQGLLAVVGESIAVHAHALGGGQFHKHLGRVHSQGVVARTALLIGMTEHCFGLPYLLDGQKAEVAEVATTRSAEMHVRESQQDGVTIVIARAPVPSAFVLVGTQLHEREGYIGSEKHVAVPTRPDVRIDVLGEGGETGNSYDQQECGQKRA